MKYTFYNIVIAAFFSWSFAYGMAADEQSSSGESQTEQEDRFEWDTLPQELQKKIIRYAMEDVLPENKGIKSQFADDSNSDVMVAAESVVIGNACGFAGGTPVIMASGKMRIIRSCSADDETDCENFQLFDVLSGKRLCKTKNYYFCSIVEQSRKRLDGTENYYYYTGWKPDWIACSDKYFAFAGNKRMPGIARTKLYVYDVHTGKTIGRSERLPFRAFKSQRGCWDQSQTQLAIAGTNTLDIYTFDKDRKKVDYCKTITCNCHSHSPLAFSPSGEQIAVKNGSVYIYDMGSRKRQLKITMPKCHHSCIAWSPSGDRIAVADERIGIYDVTSGMLQYELAASCEQLAWSPSGTIFFVSQNNFGEEIFRKIDFNLQSRWNNCIDSDQFKSSHKRQLSRTQKIVRRGRRAVSGKLENVLYTKPVNTLYLAALVSRLKAAKKNNEKIGLSPEEQAYFACVPKEVQEYLVGGIQLKDKLKLPWSSTSLYAAGMADDPDAANAQQEASDRDEL